MELRCCVVGDPDVGGPWSWFKSWLCGEAAAEDEGIVYVVSGVRCGSRRIGQRGEIGGSDYCCCCRGRIAG